MARRDHKISPSLARNFLCLAQLSDLAPQRLDPLVLRHPRARTHPWLAFGLPHPFAQRLRRAADPRRDRDNRSPWRGTRSICSTMKARYSKRTGLRMATDLVRRRRSRPPLTLRPLHNRQHRKIVSLGVV
jgi:hypothetical protein